MLVTGLLPLVLNFCSRSAISNQNVLLWRNYVTIFMRDAHWITFFHLSKPKFF